MTQQKDKNRTSPAQDRAARLAAQLRTNLRKRKDQARQIDAGDDVSKPPQEPV